jgi:regulator of sigma E protease
MMLAAVDLLAVVMTVVGLGGLIFFHELGHFLACRLTGTRVEAFSVGFGKEIIGWQRGPTRYRIGIVPLGGYVKMAAENPGEPNTGAPDEFPNKPFSQRLFIMSSGVLFNIVLAFVLFVWAFGVGVPVEQPVLGVVAPGGPGWRAGLRRGDEVTHVNGRRILGFPDLQTEVAFSGEGEELRLTVAREGRALEVGVRPEYSELLGMPQIEVLPALSREALGVTEGSPIAKAGGRADDIVLAINGHAIDHVREIADVCTRLAGRAPPGATKLDLAVKVRRARGEIETLAVELPLAERPQVGILRHEGRRVKAIADGSPLATWLRRGDEIVSVNGQEVLDLALLREEAEGAPLRAVVVRRDGQETRLEGFENVTVRDLTAAVIGDVSSKRNLVTPRAGMPAARAGLRAGDQLVRVGHTRTDSWNEIVRAILDHGQGPLALEVERANGAREELTLTPGRHPTDLGYLTGVPRILHQETGVASALTMGWRRTTLFIKSVVLTIRSLVTRRVSAEYIGGPIMLVQITYNMFDQGWGYYLYVLAIISVNLAILNILPIPILDGGQILLLCAEKLRGRPLPDRFVGYYQMVGLVLILGLLILAFRNDITRLLN